MVRGVNSSQIGNPNGVELQVEGLLLLLRANLLGKVLRFAEHLSSAILQFFQLGASFIDGFYILCHCGLDVLHLTKEICQSARCLVR